MKNSMTIHFRGGRLLSEEAERAEDRIAELLRSLGHQARIEREITGNTTTTENYKERSDKKFLVRIAFVLEQNYEFTSEDAIAYWIHENGYLYFHGETPEDEDKRTNDVTVDGGELNVSVSEIWATAIGILQKGGITMSILEYKAGMRLEIFALDMRKETGANAFFSLIHAALRQADTDNFTVLSRMFPKTHQELMMFRDSAQYNVSGTEDELVTVAKLMARVRGMLDQGLVLYEISTEIAGATGGKIDVIHEILSQHYNEIVKAYEV